MRKNNNINKILKEQKEIITQFIKTYNDKISALIQNENSTLEELNKISTLLAKNIPEIMKLQNSIQESTNKRNEKDSFIDILSIIRKDNEANILLEKLLLRISELTENSV